jgi:hypothetical protein
MQNRIFISDSFKRSFSLIILVGRGEGYSAAVACNRAAAAAALMITRGVPEGVEANR